MNAMSRSFFLRRTPGSRARMVVISSELSTRVAFPVKFRRHPWSVTNVSSYIPDVDISQRLTAAIPFCLLYTLTRDTSMASRRTLLLAVNDVKLASPKSHVTNASRIAASTTALRQIRQPSYSLLYRSFDNRCFSTSQTRRRESPGTKSRGGSKLYQDADAAVADIKSGSVILSAGFGLCGTAGLFTTIDARV